MCGLIGLYEPSGLAIPITQLQNARDTLIHRGPDAAGDYHDKAIYLGFRRLAILDLTPEGNQPMSDDDGQVWIVFNGEIYNYVELREELAAEGHVFRTNTDTEVLLALYKSRGTAMLETLNGMFALAIYDKNAKTILLARDRMGKKPLFYWLHDRTLAFASEIKALKWLPGFPTQLDDTALKLYLRLGWIPSNYCIYPGVKKLPAGSYLVYDCSKGTSNGPISYWQLPIVNAISGFSEEQWLDRIEALLWDATRIRMRSDVPLGTFLSGGIDSGLVTAAAADHTTGDLASLTIGFSDWDDDETTLATQTASKLGVKSLIHDADRDAISQLPIIMGHFDEPFDDSSAVPTSLVCKTAREYVTVALSGDGGDEVFAGYRSHVGAWRWQFLESIPLPFRTCLSRALLAIAPVNSRLRRFSHRLGYPVGTWGMGSHLYLFDEVLHPLLRYEYQISTEHLIELLETQLDIRPGATPVDQAQRTDMRLYMLDDILTKSDRMSMRNSLEVRSPFLDYRLVELGLSIPENLRTKCGANKYLLRQLALRHLPKSVVSAPKRGFGVPLAQWILNSQYSPLFKEQLLSPSSHFPDPLAPCAGERLWKTAEADHNCIIPLFRVLCYRWWIHTISSQA